MEKLDYRFQSAWTATALSNQESPIEINQSAVFMGDDWQVDWTNFQNTPVKKSQEVIGDQFYCQGQLILNQQAWHVVRFHIHDGAEHLIDGQRYAAEIHIVCQNQLGQTMVVGAFAEVDENHPFIFAPLFSEEKKMVNLQDLLPVEKRGCFTYTGSLTTPPLKKDINWVLLDEPVGISPQDLATFAEAYPDNYRECQPLFGRTVVYHHLSPMHHSK
ncbi:carbonic anhydrase family protein [Fructobacillus americanaquae]|uniref:carbonic anhydrase n=1 Tax=Fructobacillus americanaquae TaxID=2940302 RepID=A0ABY5BZI5_9LACO|nr:carbonic anhydrase family protein [Fructobacillus americanaquae]USS91502.1 carbonic anhydrase family protein [Fructobacillus americanaquae]